MQCSVKPPARRLNISGLAASGCSAVTLATRSLSSELTVLQQHSGSKGAGDGLVDWLRPTIPFPDSFP